MAKQKKNSERIKWSGERGTYNKSEWFEEAESKLTSAKLLRDVAKIKRRELDNVTANDPERKANIHQYYHPMESANKSSFLLLGYAIELLLKSGIVSLLINSPKSVLERQLRKSSHKLEQIAELLHIPLSKQDMKLLCLLTGFIYTETKYPITADSIREHCEKWNRNHSKMQNDNLFESCLSIYEKIRLVINDIDGTRKNPKTFKGVNIDNDGFVNFRVGGSLPPTFVVKYSKYQKDMNENNLKSFKTLIESIRSQEIGFELMLRCWETAVFYQVNDKNELELVTPATTSIC